jgi:hypothetical protein
MYLRREAAINKGDANCNNALCPVLPGASGTVKFSGNGGAALGPGVAAALGRVARPADGLISVRLCSKSENGLFSLIAHPPVSSL